MMFYILIALVCTSTATLAQRLPAYVVGTVNNDTIRLESFSQDIGRRLEVASMAGKTTEAQVIERAWNDAVRQAIMRQDAAARKIVTTATDVDKVLLTDPPSFVRQGFANEKGMFLPEVLKASLTNPDSLLRARNPKASSSELKQQAAELRKTMAELRTQVQSVVLEQRLRAAVLDSLPLDTNALRNTYAEVSSSCTADVVFLPCAADATPPSDLELRSWYARETNRYGAKRHMRKLALLTFSLKPTIEDSIHFAEISRRQSEMWRTASPQVRQEMLNGFKRYPDTREVTIESSDSILAPVYVEAVKHRQGDMFGPVIVSNQTYYAVIEKTASKPGAAIKVRLLRLPLQMAPQRKDSIMRIATEAIRMYDGGAELGDVAQRYSATLTATRWLTDADSIRGSYKIVDLAFNAQVGLACDPVETPDQHIVIAVVADSVDAGVMPFEKVLDEVRTDVLRDRACLIRAKAATSMRALCTRLDDGLMVVAEQLPGMDIQRDVTIDRAGTIGGTTMDAALAKAVYATSVAGLLGPVMGDRGWYVVNIQSMTKEDPNGFSAWLSSPSGRDMVEIYREAAWQNYLYNLEQRSTIIDNRWMYFNY